MYSPKLLRYASNILTKNPDTDFYVFRNPDDNVPPLIHINAVHKVNPLVPKGRLYIVDKGECHHPQFLED